MVAYRMKKMDREGATVLVMSPLELLARLGSLIPIPRRQTHRLPGVFAARSKLRSRVVVKSTKRRPKGKKEDIRELGVQYRQPHDAVGRRHRGQGRGREVPRARGTRGGRAHPVTTDHRRVEVTSG